VNNEENLPIDHLVFMEKKNSLASIKLEGIEILCHNKHIIDTHHQGVPHPTTSALVHFFARCKPWKTKPQREERKGTQTNTNRNILQIIGYYIIIYCICVPF
jgi:hypothetical protein